jgi:hypothetical protein
VYEEEVDPAVQAEREQVTPTLLELHAGLREAGLLVGVQRLRTVESATSVRVRGAETEITDGPFAVTKEVLAGYYILDCADLDEALRQAARMPMTRWGTVEVRPVESPRRVGGAGAAGRRRRARRGGERPGVVGPLAPERPDLTLTARRQSAPRAYDARRIAQSSTDAPDGAADRALRLTRGRRAPR